MINFDKYKNKNYLGYLFSKIKKLSTNHIDCYILNESPLILISDFKDFCDNILIIKAYVYKKNLPVYVMLTLGYHVETRWRVDDIKLGLSVVRNNLPDAKLTFLTNSEREAENLRPLGVSAIFCHQNAFLDINKYPLVKCEKKFDAIYLARFTPAKRYELASNIKSLLIIGDYKAEEEEYFQKSISILRHAQYFKKIYSFQVSKIMASARVGLALSSEEGAMYVAGEYLLSGIPVVSTENLGGRHHLIPPQYLNVVTDSSKAVSDGVTNMISMDFNPVEIRNATIANMEIHQNRLREYLSVITNFHNGTDYTESFPHKMALRTWVPIRLRSRMISLP